MTPFLLLRRFLVIAAVVCAMPVVANAADDTITLAVRLEPPHLDPTAGAAAAIDEIVYSNVFEGLTRIGPDGTVGPGLAESWTISDDGLTYTFALHTGVKYHDGTDFDSADVIFSLDRARGEDSTNAQKVLFEPIESVSAPDAQTVVIRLQRPTGNFTFSMGWGDAIIVAPESAEDNKANPVGTGPFRFARWVRGDRIEIERNPDYWGEPVHFNRAVFKIISDPAAALASLLAGDVDAFPQFPAPENLPQLQSDDRFEVVLGTTEGETILSMNNAQPPLDDVRVRRAIAYAIDRQAIIDGAMFGQGTPIGTHFAPHHPAYVDLTGCMPTTPTRPAPCSGRPAMATG